ncbi:MAG: response regulator receiver protein [bacterium]|nr:response regulator receiver protein [bacterium]
MQRTCNCATPTLLVVDDDRHIRETLAELLSEDGYHVFTAEHGARALQRMRGEHICMVLLDLMMPTKSGWQVLAELIGDPQLPRVPVGVISALVTETPLGTVGVLHKPLDLDSLLKLVHTHAGVPAHH